MSDDQQQTAQGMTDEKLVGAAWRALSRLGVRIQRGDDPVLLREDQQIWLLVHGYVPRREGLLNLGIDDEVRRKLRALAGPYADVLVRKRLQELKYRYEVEKDAWVKPVLILEPEPGWMFTDRRGKSP